MFTQSPKNNARQIDKVGKRWGLHHMVGAMGNVLVAEDIHAKIPLVPGMFIIEKIERDVCEMNSEYTWGCVLRNRIDREGRKAALSMEIMAIEADKKERELKTQRREEMVDFMRHATGERMYFGGK